MKNNEDGVDGHETFEGYTRSIFLSQNTYYSGPANKQTLIRFKRYE